MKWYHHIISMDLKSTYKSIWFFDCISITWSVVTDYWDLSIYNPIEEFGVEWCPLWKKWKFEVEENEK